MICAPCKVLIEPMEIAAHKDKWLCWTAIQTSTYFDFEQHDNPPH